VLVVSVNCSGGMAEGAARLRRGGPQTPERGAEPFGDIEIHAESRLAEHIPAGEPRSSPISSGKVPRRKGCGSSPPRWAPIPSTAPFWLRRAVVCCWTVTPSSTLLPGCAKRWPGCCGSVPLDLELRVIEPDGATHAHGTGRALTIAPTTDQQGQTNCAASRPGLPARLRGCAQVSR
jgi:hypothetical protein